MMFILFFLAAFIIVAFQPVTADLNCDFARGACDWRQLKSNCSWGVSSKRGLAFVQNYCANATLKANIGWYEKKDLYLKYYMNGQGSASLTIKAGIGNSWWNSMPIEVYSCDQPMGINWKTDRIRLPKNTQYVTVEAVIGKDAKYIIALDQIRTGNFESGQKFVKKCTLPSATTKSTTSTQMNTPNKSDVASTTQFTKSTRKSVTSATQTVSMLSPTTTYSQQKMSSVGSKFTTKPQKPLRKGEQHTTSKSFSAISFTAKLPTTTPLLTTKEILTSHESERMSKTTSSPQTEINRKPVGIRKDKNDTRTKILKTTDKITRTMFKTKFLSTSSTANPTGSTTTTESTTTSEPTTTIKIKTTTKPTTTTEFTTATTIKTTTAYSATSRQPTTQPSTTKKTEMSTTPPKIITTDNDRVSVQNGKFTGRKTVIVTQRKTTPVTTRKTISRNATITTAKVPTTPQTTTATTARMATAKPTKYWGRETTTLISRLIITPNIFDQSSVENATQFSDEIDDCLYCFNETDSLLNSTDGRPFDSDVTIEHLSTIVVVASFFAILLIYALLKFFIGSMMRWRKRVKVDKDEKDMTQRSSTLTPGLYIVDDSCRNGVNENVSGSVYRTRQDSIYHMELPSQN